MTLDDRIEHNQAKSGRIVFFDLARGIALLAMATYHFAWDLEFFGYASAGLTEFGAWKIYARCIAASFLLLVGVSLVLAHDKGIRWKGFWKRFAMVVVAAFAITLVTYWATPEAFIFFGILHQIALASLLGLAFLRLPSLLTLAIGVLVVVTPAYFRSPIFDHPSLWWVGLSPVNPRSNDYVPLFPWFGVVLVGIAVTKMAISANILVSLRKISPGRWAHPVILAGRHGLAFYLIHQPVLIAIVWMFSQIMPAHVETRQQSFLSSCQASCEDKRENEFCSRYCVCMLDTLETENSLDAVFTGNQTPEAKAHIGELAGQCTASTDDEMIGSETK